MPRSTALWSSDNHDAKIPARVRLRLFEAAGGRCAICNRKLGPADKWQADHIVALINGGEHSEANLQVACDWCHREKTAEDVAFKAKSARIRARHAGVKRGGGWGTRPLGTGNHQHTATSPITRKSDRSTP